MLRLVAMLVAVLLTAFVAKAGGAGLKAQVMGGTLPDLTPRASARIDLTDNEVMRVFAGKAELTVPYRRIEMLEYGQNVSRRYAEAILLSPVLLLSKSRKHFVTIGYEDVKMQRQVVIFRVEKGDIRAVLAGLEAHSGRRFVFQDEEARKAGQ